MYKLKLPEAAKPSVIAEKEWRLILIIPEIRSGGFSRVASSQICLLWLKHVSCSFYNLSFLSVSDFFRLLSIAIPCMARRSIPSLFPARVQRFQNKLPEQSQKPESQKSTLRLQWLVS